MIDLKLCLNPFRNWSFQTVNWIIRVFYFSNHTCVLYAYILFSACIWIELWRHNQLQVTATKSVTNSMHNIELCMPLPDRQAWKWYFFNIWSYCDLDLWPLIPKTNRFIYVLRCISSKSLEKIHQCALEISWKQTPQMVFFTHLVMLWPWPLTFWPHHLTSPSLPQGALMTNVWWKSLNAYHRHSGNNIPDRCTDGLTDGRTDGHWTDRPNEIKMPQTLPYTEAQNGRTIKAYT